MKKIYQQVRHALFGALIERRLQSELAKNAQDAILFRREFPPLTTERHLSFLGGFPVGPRDFDWPRPLEPQNDPAVPWGVSFLGQIDLSSLPAIAGRDLLPRDGVLYFFHDWSMITGEDLPSFGHMIRYYKGDTKTFVDIAPPADLCDLYGNHDETCWGHNDWTFRCDREHLDIPKIFPKCLVTLHPVQTFGSPDIFDANSRRYDELRDIAETKALRAILGDAEETEPPIPHDESLWHPSDAFPEYWLYIEITAGSIQYHLLKSPEEYEADINAARAWVHRARLAGLFTPVPDPDRNQFWLWLEKMRDEHAGKQGVSLISWAWNKLNAAMGMAIKFGSSYLLAHSEKTAAGLSPEIRDMAMWYNRPSRYGSEYVRHQMLGIGKGIPSIDDHILLMQFDTDWGMNWEWWDGGVMHYWITPDDLKALRFDRVVVTIEGG